MSRYLPCRDMEVSPTAAGALKLRSHLLPDEHLPRRREITRD